MQNKSDIFVSRISNPIRATGFPNSNDFYPTPGVVVGEEFAGCYPERRFIFKYDSAPIRKSNNERVRWANGEVYLWEKDLKFQDKID